MTKKRAPASGERDAAPLVLVVDDFEDNRAMYVEYLQFHGFRVVEAVNGEDAVRRTKELLPAVVLMDLSLPVMDGWEATRQIKADPKTAHIRVVALTGHAEPAHAKKALDARCDDFVAKPCLPENLLAKIREHLPASDAKGFREEGEQSRDGEPGGLVSAGTGKRPKGKR